MQIAHKGFAAACEENPAICEGVNTFQGHITYAAVAESQNQPWQELAEVL
jgi:alanine dehydrogenase